MMQEQLFHLKANPPAASFLIRLAAMGPWQLSMVKQLMFKIKLLAPMHKFSQLLINE
jgi:hypothetical protein